MDQGKVEVHEKAKSEQLQYPAIFTELTWSIKDLLYGIPHLHVTLCFYSCVCWFLLQNVFLKLISIFVSLFSFSMTLSVFSFHPNREITENLFTVTGTSAKFYCGNKTGNPKRAVSLHLACLGNQSQCRIWFTLPAHRASHIINKLTDCSAFVQFYITVTRDCPILVWFNMLQCHKDNALTLT